MLVKMPFVFHIKRTYHTWLNVGILECFDLSSHLINLAIECLCSLNFFVSFYADKVSFLI